MNRDYIREKANQTLIDCGIKYFPFNCLNLLQHYGYKIYTYAELKHKNEELYNMCISYSEDAFRIGSKFLIAYNDQKPDSRIRFSLMHELGHHILEHRNNSAGNEAEANYFASNILAPRMAIYYAKCKTIYDIKRTFSLSTAASKCAADDFYFWCLDICRNRMTDSDRKLYEHFYNKDYNGFVYSKRICEFCGKPVYNSDKPLCKNGCILTCEVNLKRPSYLFSTEYKRAIMRFENKYIHNY